MFNNLNITTMKCLCIFMAMAFLYSCAAEVQDHSIGRTYSTDLTFIKADKSKSNEFKAGESIKVNMVLSDDKGKIISPDLFAGNSNYKFKNDKIKLFLSNKENNKFILNFKRVTSQQKNALTFLFAPDSNDKEIAGDYQIVVQDNNRNLANIKKIKPLYTH